MRAFAAIAGLFAAILFTIATATCTGSVPSANLLPAPTQTTLLPTNLSSSESANNLPLRTLRDIPLSGGATRLDYQSLDSGSGRLYIAHLGSDLMTVFD